jgi:hypothetical protein
MTRDGLAAIAVGLLLTAPAAATAQPPAGQALDSQIKAAPVLALSRCYGRFIAWRDELSSAMIETGTPPSASAPARFNRVETAFAALTLRDRKLTLRLQPAFHESDFPADMRQAFRVGLAEAGQVFQAPAYRSEHMRIFAEADAATGQRMGDLETQTDAAFEDLGRPCDRLAKELDWVKVLNEASAPNPAKAPSKPLAKAPKAAAPHKPGKAKAKAKVAKARAKAKTKAA